MLYVQNKNGQILNVLSLQIILNKKSLIITLFLLKIGYEQNQARRLTEKSLLQKNEKGG